MLQLRVGAIKWETGDTTTFLLTEASGKKIDYKAGQFITLVFTHRDEEIRRSYSLSSSPDDDLLSITVKRIANGEISRFMLTKVKPGDIFNAVEPAGRFTVSSFAEQKDIMFFAAGSGIVPILSQLKYILNREGDSKLTLFYSSQDRYSVLFADTLTELQSQHPDRLKIVHLLSNEGKRLNNVGTENLVKRFLQFELSKADFYLCGPFAYMRTVRLTLLFMGIDNANIRKENFVLDTVPVDAGYINYQPRYIRIKHNNEVHDLMVGENQTILQAALQNKLQLPYSCRVGICSACTATCTSGRIDMPVNDVLTDLDLSHGLVLTCTGHPVSDDVVIEYL